MEKKLKVYCVGSPHDANWLLPYGFSQTSFYDDADIVIFPGGSDWNPALYGESEGKKTYYNDSVDKHQLKFALNCIRDRKFMIGICRGAQMLCILAGGKLIQDVTSHAGYDHEIETVDGQTLFTNSIHHQMMDVFSIPSQTYELLGWAKPFSTHYLDGNNSEKIFKSGNLYREELTMEPEIVYYNLIGGFGIQGHPEMSLPTSTTKYIVENIKKYYNEFNKNHKKLPEYINKRIKFINEFHFNNVTNKTQNNEKSNQNRNSELEKWRWEY